MSVPSYDTACEELAMHFLIDYPPEYTPLAPKLAWTIQRAVEDWLGSLDSAIAAGEEVGP